MRIVPIEEAGQRKWDDFVSSCDQAWFLHLYDVIKAKNMWPRHRNDSFAVVEETGRIGAIFPMHHISGTRKKIIPYHMLNSLGGMAVRNEYAGTKQEDKIWDFCKDHISQTHKSTGTAQIEIWLNAMIPSLRGEKCPRVNPLVMRGMDNILTQTWVVDLRKSEDELRAAMAKGFRESLKKSENANLQIREAAPSQDDLNNYYKLHADTCTRSKIDPHPIAYFRHVWETCLKDKKCRVIFAEHKGEIVSAINYVNYKKAGAYWTGASSQKALELCANHALHWYMVRFLKADGCEWAEIGEAVFSGGDDKHIAISDFKSRMGGTLYPYYKASMKIL